MLGESDVLNFEIHSIFFSVDSLERDCSGLAG